MDHFSASPTPAPSPSTDPPPSDGSLSISNAQEFDRALASLLPGGGPPESWELMEAILSRHPEIMHGSRSLLQYKTALLIRDSTTRRLERLNDAVESSRQALALSPNSISFALFHAILLFELARNGAGSYDAVVQDGERALLIENPTDPGYEVPVPASRLEKMRKVLAELIEKSKRQIIILGGGNRGDKWKRLLEDNSLAEVKAEFEATLRRKMKIPGRRAPLGFESPSLDDRVGEKRKIKKHKKVESNDVATISRVRAFWNDKMSVENKRELLRIGIEDLKAYLDKNKLRMAKEVLTEAIDYAKVEKLWSFWACYYCGQRVFDSDTDKHLWDHLGALSESFRSLFPDEAPEWAFNMVENGVWKPVELNCAAEIMERQSAAADWPYIDDSERAEIIERIRMKLQLFKRNRCLACSHLNWLQYLIIELLQNQIPKPKIADLWPHHKLHLIRFLEVPGLNRVLGFLEDLANGCALRCLGEVKSEEDVRGNQWFWDNARERVVFSSDFSALLFDDRLLRGETVVAEIGNAVVTSTTVAEDCDADCDSDALVDWLWTERPTIGEQIKAWTSLREGSKSRGMIFYEIVEDESRRLHRMCERKGEYLRYNKPMYNVESICIDEDRKREQISGYHPQGYVSLLFKRWKELETEDDDDAELDIIWSIIKEPEAESEIQMAIKRQKTRLDREVLQLLLLDAIILSTVAAIRQTGLQAGMVCLFDYRFVMVPQLKSFMKAHLEDLVNKDAAEKSNAATEALLAELALDAEKNTDKGGRQGPGKSKDKKKKKDHRQHPSSVPAVVSSEPDEDVGSGSETASPLPLSRIQFGNVNWTEFCQAHNPKNLI